MRQSDPKKRHPALLYRAAELLFAERGQGRARLGMKEIAERLQKEFGKDLKITRETIYPLVEEAARQHLVRLVPPVELALRQQLVARFPGLAEDEVEVVETTGPDDNEKVAALAAEKALAALVRIAKTKPGEAVGIGLGPGRATLEFCRYLGPRLQMHDQALKLLLVAITAGCPATMLENAPISFLNLFPEHLVQRRKFGLFAETLVRVGAFKGLAGHTGVKEAFAAKKAIDLVVTAMGDFHDPHDLLCMFLKDSGQDLAALRKRGWVGNVQYRPFTANGPAHERPRDWRAVTVFELEDLVKLAEKRSKEVILMARQCGMCDRTRAEALRPLLTNPKLKVFSTLILDAATARELLQ
jgi:DNA-binding transcriptional regulator LsrR (DeoR family)